jgi:diguanylate cyclase (GGDEF)-like protein
MSTERLILKPMVPATMVKVLLVEDNANDALLLRRLLRMNAPGQFEVTHKGCMEDAVAYAASHVVVVAAAAAAAAAAIDIVLLDLGLPDANGLDAVHQMLAAAPRAPVVVMTGRDDEEMAAQALRAGAQDFLVKGELEPSTVLRAMRYAIERKALEERLFLEQERAQSTLNAIGDAVICIDEGATISFLNRAARVMTGLALPPGGRLMSEALDLRDSAGAPVSLRRALDATVPKALADPSESLTTTATVTASLAGPTGALVPIEYTVSDVRDRLGAPIGAVYVLRDVSETRALAAKLAHMAQHDTLTGLPNRMLLADRIGSAIAIAPRRQSTLGVMFLDLDGFKHVNDTLGHAVGDRLLQSVALRLASCVRGSDTVSRVGGDEFVVLLTEIMQPQDAAIAATRMLDAVSAPHFIGEHVLHVTTSIGISLFSVDSMNAETLIKNADTAMYQAKANGRKSYRFFEASMNLQAVERQSIETGLRDALARDELVLHYQPILDLATGRVHGAEALVRWNHPVKGLMPPGAFIPVAEESGLIVPLGNWVLREACGQAKAWSASGLPLRRIAVNVSAIEFQNEHFLSQVFEILQQTGIAPEMLELELTESVLMKRPGIVAETLKALRAEGVRLAIDDFGTGVSSLSYLVRLPVDTLKIDQCFVRQITETPSETAIVRAVLSMARSLNLRVVAEGVESRAALAFLQACQCDAAQGYYFSPPMPRLEFEAFVRANAARLDCVAEGVTAGGVR